MAAFLSQFNDPYFTTAAVIVGLALLAFALLAWKDVSMLVRRPMIEATGRRLRMGMGLTRMWGVARCAVLESWAAKIWIIPFVMLAISTLIIIWVTRSFDPMDQIPQYLHILLNAQRYITLLTVGVLAGRSLPLERERRTIISTASKPLSRLELLLGKIVGFSMVAALLLLAMGVLTGGYLVIGDWMARRDAGLRYEDQLKHINDKVTATPLMSEKLLHDKGSLHAYDYITAQHGMQVAGEISYSTDPNRAPLKWARGGGEQSVYYQFKTLVQSPAQPPYFFFQFGWKPTTEGQAMPEDPQIVVELSRASDPKQREEATLHLKRPVNAPPDYLAVPWQPSDLSNFFAVAGYKDSDPGPLIVKVNFPTEGMLFNIYDGSEPQNDNVLAMNLYPGPGGTTAMVEGPAAHPIMRGFQRRDQQQVRGDPSGDGDVASWRFDNIRRDSLPLIKVRNEQGVEEDCFTLTLRLDVDKDKNQDIPAQALLRVYGVLDQTHFWEYPLLVEEKMPTQIYVPARMLDPKGADMIVDLRCLTPGHWLGFSFTDVRLEKSEGSFFLNLLKSESVIFLECVLLAAICVVTSVRLGWPVAMFLSAVIYVLGNSFEFIDYLMKVSGFTLFTQTETRAIEGSFFYQAITMASDVSLKMAFMLVNLLPDFTRFDPTQYIAVSRAMPLDALGYMAAWLAIGMVPFVAVGFLAMRKQEYL